MGLLWLSTITAHQQRDRQDLWREVFIDAVGLRLLLTSIKAASSALLARVTCIPKWQLRCSLVDRDWLGFIRNG